VAVLAAGLGVVFFLIGLWAGLDSLAAGIFAVGIIVANVPEGLLPTVTLALAMVPGAWRGMLVRHLPAVATLGSTTVICTDKIGTLTANRMTASALWLARAARDEPPLLGELPFDSDRRRMSVLRRGPDGPVLHVKGAPETILASATRTLAW
jgi:P-type E1-E2 ATPase